MPIGGANVFLLTALFAPHMKMPTPEGPIPRIVKEPQPIKQRVTIKSQRINKLMGRVPHGQQKHRQMGDQGVRKEHRAFVLLVKISSLIVSLDGRET